jgi:NAD(P)-dependent dehydrogenase (short-subunit alcohol dehydrogenase family)
MIYAPATGNVGRVFSRREETEDGFEASLALIFLGPYALTSGLRRLLLTSAPARIVNMNSSAYKMWEGDPLRDLQSEEKYVGIRAHARAKLLNLIWTVALARELEGRGVTVNAVNPGSAWTPGTTALTPEAVPFWRPIWPIVRFFQRRGSPAKAAQTPIWLATDPAAAEATGSFFEKKRQQELPELARNRDQQEKVLMVAAELVRTARTAAPLRCDRTTRNGSISGPSQLSQTRGSDLLIYHSMSVGTTEKISVRFLSLRVRGWFHTYYGAGWGQLKSATLRRRARRMSPLLREGQRQASQSAA